MLGSDCLERCSIRLRSDRFVMEPPHPIPMDMRIQIESRQFDQVRTDLLTRQNFVAKIFEAKQLMAIKIRKADALS